MLPSMTTARGRLARDEPGEDRHHPARARRTAAAGPGPPGPSRRRTGRGGRGPRGPRPAGWARDRRRQGVAVGHPAEGQRGDGGQVGLAVGDRRPEHVGRARPGRRPAPRRTCRSGRARGSGRARRARRPSPAPGSTKDDLRRPVGRVERQGLAGEPARRRSPRPRSAGTVSGRGAVAVSQAQTSTGSPGNLTAWTVILPGLVGEQPDRRLRLRLERPAGDPRDGAAGGVAEGRGRRSHGGRDRSGTGRPGGRRSGPGPRRRRPRAVRSGASSAAIRAGTAARSSRPMLRDDQRRGPRGERRVVQRLRSAAGTAYGPGLAEPLDGVVLLLGLRLRQRGDEPRDPAPGRSRCGATAALSLSRIGAGQRRGSRGRRAAGGSSRRRTGRGSPAGSRRRACS